MGLVLLTLAGCDGVGREIVDYEKPPPRKGTLPDLPCEPPICAEAIAEVELDDSIAMRLHSPAPNSCTHRFDTCALTDDAVCSEGEVPDPALLDERSVICGDLSLTLAVDDGECSFRIERLAIEHTILRIRSERACELELPQLVARDARIELTGPVTLVIGERAELERTSFTAQANVDGQPALEIDLAQATQAAIGDEELPFEGFLSVGRSTLTDSSVHAEDVLLESAVFINAKLDAREIEAADAVFSRAVLDVGDAVLAACAFDSVEVRSCEALLLAGSEIYDSVFRGCGDAWMRFYNSSVGRSMLDGRIESDSSNLEGVVFGSEAPTEVVQFGGVINKAAYCGKARSYRLGELANSTCARCDARDSLKPGGACSVSEIDNVQPGRHCEALAELDACDDDDEHVPRLRPPTPPRL